MPFASSPMREGRARTRAGTGAGSERTPRIAPRGVEGAQEARARRRRLPQRGRGGVARPQVVRPQRTSFGNELVCVAVLHSAASEQTPSCLWAALPRASTTKPLCGPRRCGVASAWVDFVAGRASGCGSSIATCTLTSAAAPHALAVGHHLASSLPLRLLTQPGTPVSLGASKGTWRALSRVVPPRPVERAPLQAHGRSSSSRPCSSAELATAKLAMPSTS